jgi:hypothetical protein
VRKKNKRKKKQELKFETRLIENLYQAVTLFLKNKLARKSEVQIKFFSGVTGVSIE